MWMTGPLYLLRIIYEVVRRYLHNKIDKRYDKVTDAAKKGNKTDE